MSVPTIADLLERNKSTSATHTPIPTFDEMLAGGNMRTVKTLIVTCLDGRCNPEKFFNLQPGDPVLVQRNGGGSVRDALREILSLDYLIPGGFNEIAIVHHTDCGLLRYTDEEVRSGIKARVGEAHWAEVDGMAFGALTDVHESAKSDLRWIRANPLVREELRRATQAFVFDIKSGKVEKVDVE